jgi:hypothetical protein
MTILALGLSGCASSTGVLEAGPDTYTVTELVAPILGGRPEAQRVALNEAYMHCQQQRRLFVPQDMNEAGSADLFGPTGFKVTFRCPPAR